MTTQINTQEIIKKDFINIFEISHLSLTIEESARKADCQARESIKTRFSISRERICQERDHS